MKSIYMVVFAAHWTIFNCFAWGSDGGADRADFRITYTRESLLYLHPPAAAASGNVPLLLRSKDNAATDNIMTKSHRRAQSEEIWAGWQTPALSTPYYSSLQCAVHCNKVDNLEAYARYKQDFRHNCLLAFPETWLRDADNNKDLHISVDQVGCHNKQIHPRRSLLLHQREVL